MRVWLVWLPLSSPTAILPPSSSFPQDSTWVTTTLDEPTSWFPPDASYPNLFQKVRPADRPSSATEVPTSIISWLLLLPSPRLLPIGVPFSPTIPFAAFMAICRKYLWSPAPSACRNSPPHSGMVICGLNQPGLFCHPGLPFQSMVPLCSWSPPWYGAQPKPGLPIGKSPPPEGYLRHSAPPRLHSSYAFNSNGLPFPLLSPPCDKQYNICLNLWSQINPSCVHSWSHCSSIQAFWFKLYGALHSLRSHTLSYILLFSHLAHRLSAISRTAPYWELGGRGGTRNAGTLATTCLYLTPQSS